LIYFYVLALRDAFIQFYKTVLGEGMAPWGFLAEGAQAQKSQEHFRRGRCLTEGPIKPEVAIDPKHTVLNKHLSRFQVNESWKGITSWLSAPAERQINRLSAHVANLELRTTDTMHNI